MPYLSELRLTKSPDFGSVKAVNQFQTDSAKSMQPITAK